MNQALVSQTELLALYAGLFLMMIGVALEATRADWRQCFQHPRIFWAALGSQLIGVPLVGFLLIQIIPLNEQVAIGILLISLCPGGVMSNFFSTRAHGNVALSSSLTLVSSLLVPLTFPIGVFLLAQWNDGLATVVEVEGLTQIALLTADLTFPPFILGTLCKRHLPSLAQRLSKPLKVFSFALVGVVIIGALYTNRELLATEIWEVLPAAFIFNGLLLFLGYQIARLLKSPNNIKRTLAIELGIQNATVALILIPILFPNQTGAFNMVAFWGVWHLISGLAISLYWGRATPAGQESMA